MDNTNLVDIPNPGFVRLKATLKRNNQKLPQRRRSYAKTCIDSCRGQGGAAHSKFYLFSKTGKAKNVVMQGSANLTVAGAVNQWNDLDTWVDNKQLYKFAAHVYHQMWQDQPVAQQFVERDTGKDLLGFTPRSWARISASTAVRDMMFQDMIRIRDLAGAWLIAAMILPKTRLRSSRRPSAALNTTPGAGE
jgi:hypothetical protein